MKSIFPKSYTKNILPFLFFLLTCSLYSQQDISSQKEKSSESKFESSKSYKRIETAAPASAITGNFSICLPGPTTTQLFGAGIPAPITATTPWFSSNPAVATIDATGLVTSVSFGATTITYTDNLGNTTSENVYVSTYPTISGVLNTCVGGQTQLTGSLFPNPTLPWDSLDPSIATVDATGLVTGVSGGTATIVYKNLGGCTVTASVVINPLLSPTITCGAATFNQVTYNWTPVLGASTYTIAYNINSTGWQLGPSGNILTWTKTGLLPSDSVEVFITPVGAGGNCFTGGFQTCVTNSCTPASSPATPVFAVTQPTCSTATGTITVTGVGGETYSLDAGTFSGTLIYGGLAPGPHTITAKNGFGCKTSTGTITINPQPVTPTTPVIGTITPPTCALSTGSVAISGLPAGNWTLNQAGTVVNSIAGNTTSTTISGLITGNYTFSVTNSVSCTSPVSVNVNIPTQPVTPTTPVIGTITPPTCALATGSVALSGLPAGNWTLNQAGTAVNSIAGNTTSTTISGLAAGNYTFSVTNSVNCTSAVSLNVNIPTQPITPTTPVIGTITPPTCALATGSIAISGLPAGNWTLNQAGTAVNSIVGNTTSTTISGLAAGNYTFSVTNSVSCTSPVSVNVNIPTQPVTPTTPVIGTITPPTCALATGSVAISGLPAGNWTLNQAGTVVNSIAGNTTSTTISGLAAGNYTFSVTNSVSCTSTVSVNVNIPTQPITPTTPIIGTITPPTCALATGSVAISGLPTGNWTLNQTGTVANSIAGNTTSTTISGLAAGNYTFSVTNSVSCTSPVSVNVNIPTQPVTPTTPVIGTITPPTCALATGSVGISGLPAGNWTLNQAGTVVNSIAGNTTSTTISGLAAGNYTFSVTNSVSCTSPVSVNVNIPTQPVTPTTPVIGTITPPTCALATGSIAISGLPAGNWTLNQAGTAVNSIAGNTTSTTISGLAAGNYTFSVTNSVSCTSPVSVNVNIPTQPVTPTTPVIGTITPPTCALATGSVAISGLPAGNWTLNQAGTTVNSIAGNTTSTTISGLAAGNYTFSVTNSVSCTSSVSANVNIPTQPITPTTPIIGTITPPTCALATGSVAISGLPAGNWTLNQAGTAVNSIAGNTTSTTISGLAAGNYTFSVTNSVSCTSTVSVNVNIPTQPVTPTTPVIGTITPPTCALATGSVAISGLPAGNWTINQAGTTVNSIAGNTTSTTISGLAAGNYTFSVINSVSCTSSVSVNVNIPTQPVTPTTPVIGTITPPTCTLATGSVDISGLPAGNWTLNQAGTVANAILGNTTSTTISGLAAGNYTFSVTNADGCTSIVSANVNIPTQPVTPTTPVIGTITPPTCALATGSVDISGLPAGNWTLNQAGTAVNSIAGNTTSTTISGLAAGNYTFSVTNSVSCTSTVSVNVNIPTQPVTPTTPVVGTIAPPTCALATGSVDISGLPAGNWTLNQAGTVANAILGNTTSTTISGLVAGNYTFSVTNADGCTSIVSANVNIPTQPVTPTTPIIGTITPPTCTLATGSVDISGLPAGNWTLNQAGTVVNTIAGNTTSTTIFGLATGNYTFSVTNADGCTSTVSLNVNIPTQPIPTIPLIGTITPPTCTLASGSVDISGLPAGNWTLNQAGTAVNSIAGNTTSTTISGLAAGNYTFSVTNSVSCTSSVSANVNIPTQPVTPTTPVIGTITPPTCALATGSVDISGLPAGNWTINQAGTAVNAILGNTTSTTLSGLATGNYTFSVTNADGCTSIVSANVNIPTQPVTPTTPVVGTITPPTCALATGSVDISGLPAGNWTLNQAGAVANAILGNTTSTTISGLTAGNYTFSVTNADGCTSIVSANVNIPTQPVTPTTPVIGTITPPTCTLATGSVDISGLPAGNWTINQAGTAVNAILGNTTSTTISGLAAGNYTFSVTNADGCISTVSVNVNIPTQPVTPTTPVIGTITPPTCTLATGSVDISGLPAGNWTLNQAGTAVNSIAGNTTSTTISGLAAGNYTFSVTNSVSCTSSVSVNVNIPAQPVTPTTPVIGTITPPTCALATGSVDISGLPAGNWTLNQAGTAVNSIAGNTTSTTISGLAAGNYTFSVTNSVSCTSSVSVNVNIPTQPVTPTTPVVGTITPPTCALATGSVDISGLPAGNWTLNQAGAVANAILGNTTSTTISGLTAGNYTFSVTNADGCTSIVSANVNIPTQPVTPTTPVIGTITPPTCTLATGLVDISGLPAGNWTINQAGTAVNAILGNTTSTTLSGLATGNYTFSVTNADGCTSTVSVNVNIPTQPVTPTTPVIGTITPPTCTLATGSVDISGLPLGNWTINQAGTVANAILGNTTSTTISGLAAGNYTFSVTNADGCTSIVSVNVNIPTQPVTPTTPVIGTITPPTCALATGSVDISGLPAGNWTINQAGTIANAILGNTSSTTISGLVAGNYTFSVTNSVGCTSTVSANANITIQPVTPTTPVIGIITPPTCTLATGSVDISGLPVGNWTINQAGTTVNTILGNTTSTTISGLAAGNYTFSVTNADGCTSIVSANVNIPTQPVTPTTPVIGTITPPTCALATGLVDISGLPAGNWTLNQAGTAVNSIAGNTTSTTISGLAAGNYTFSVTNSVSCTSSVSVNVNIPTQPVTPTTPVIGTITPPTCALATGSVDISGLPAGNWTLNQAGTAVNSIAGNTTSTTISGLAAGNYTFSVTNSVSCTSSVSVNVNIPTQPVTPTTPVVGTITPPTCTLATGSVDISGLPAGNWTLNQAGVAVNAILGNTTSTTISGLTAGNYTFSVTNVDGCTSIVSANVNIPTQPGRPPAPILSSPIPPECELTPIQTLNANSGAVSVPIGQTIDWYTSPNGGTPISSPTLNTVGTITYYAEANDGICPSYTRTPVILTISDTPSLPSVVKIDPSCTDATGTITITSLPGLTYSFDGQPYSLDFVHPNLVQGTTHTVIAQTIAGCKSPTATITLSAQPPTPNMPVLIPTQPTCTNPSGAITIAGVLNEIYSFDGGPYVTTLVYSPLIASSTHTAKAKNNFGCISAEATLTLNIQPSTPSSPILTPIQPSCTNPTGGIMISGVVGEIYSLDGQPFSPSLTYTNLPASSNHNVRAQNAATCISVPAAIALNAQPPSPAVPSITITQPSCSLDTGTITINAVAGEIYSFDGSTYNNTTLVYSGLAQNSSHTINAQNGFTCTSTINVTLDPQPPTPKPVLVDGAICVDQASGIVFQPYLLNTTLNATNHTFAWYFNGNPITDTTSYLQVNQAGDYGVIATNTFGCSNALVQATVTDSYPGISFTTTVEGQFSNNSSVIVNVNSGNAIFSYQLDNGPFQTSNIFTNVSPGQHTINVIDNNGCTNLSNSVIVLGYPNFFTPNNDAYNDTWNIIGLNNQPNAKVHIYDRYGKYIKQISPSNGEGWDGTMNGSPLPSTDYWFTVEYTENGQAKEFKSHFSLVR